jgi:hypothetical protein
MKKRAVLTALLAVVLGGFAYYLWAERATPAGQPPLATLDAAGLEALRTEFNVHADKVRIVVLFSPT